MTSYIRNLLKRSLGMELFGWVNLYEKDDGTYCYSRTPHDSKAEAISMKTVHPATKYLRTIEVYIEN